MRTAMLSLIGLLIVVCKMMGGDAAAVTGPPANTSVLLGARATIHCGVTGEQGGLEFLQFKKLTPPPSILLSQDSVVNNATKHEITDKYRLHVNNFSLKDEGEYACELTPNGADHRVYITASDPPTNLSVFWSGRANSMTPGITTNLTCRSQSSRPPADLRWFRDGTDVTSDAIYMEGTTDNDGYGPSESRLPQTPLATDVGTTYRCAADVPGGYNVIEKSLVLKFSNGADTLCGSALIMVTMATALLCRDVYML